jgi:triphosphatase
MAKEIELKLGIPTIKTMMALLSDDRVLGVEAGTVHMRATYFDTEEMVLSKKRIGVRLRREDDAIVATLKYGGGVKDGMHTRVEVNRPKETFTLSVDDFPEEREMLAQVLGDQDLIPLIETDIIRHLRRIEYKDSVLECALDEGTVQAAGKSVEIRELEVELLEGSQEDLEEFCRERLTDYHLIPEDMSKLARGIELLNMNA